MQGNNSAVNKRTVRPRRKIGAAAWHAAAEACAGRPGSPCFRRGFPDCTVASVGPWRQINDTDIRSVGSKIRTPSRRLSSFIGLYRLLPTRLTAALEGSA